MPWTGYRSNRPVARPRKRVWVQRLPAQMHIRSYTHIMVYYTYTVHIYIYIYIERERERERGVEENIQKRCNTHTHTCGETQKFPELFKKYLKYSYNFETLFPFKELPLWLGAAIPAPLPLLETLSKIFNRNVGKGGQQFSLNLCNVGKTYTFQVLIHLWEHKKVGRSDVGPVGEGQAQPPFCL